MDRPVDFHKKGNDKKSNCRFLLFLLSFAQPSDNIACGRRVAQTKAKKEESDNSIFYQIGRASCRERV